MKAAVVEEIAKPLVVHSHWPDPDCGLDDAVVEVQANGICLSDHHSGRGAGPGWVLRLRRRWSSVMSSAALLRRSARI